MAIGSVEYLLGRRQVEKIYHELKIGDASPDSFFRSALACSRIDTQIDGYSLSEIPSGRPVLLVANHPFGVVDGLVLSELALRLGGDFRILVHSIMCTDDFLARYFLPVDFSATTSAARRNIQTKHLAQDALRRGIPVAIFPAGAVSTAKTRFGFGPVEELPWTTFAAKLALASNALVLPVYFHGHNSRVFQVASSISEPLRVSLLLRETLRKQGTSVRVTIGEPVDISEMQMRPKRTELTHLLYKKVAELGFTKQVQGFTNLPSKLHESVI